MSESGGGAAIIGTFVPPAKAAKKVTKSVNYGLPSSSPQPLQEPKVYPGTSFGVQIDGNLIPCEQFNIVGGAYGSVGHVTVLTSRAALDAAKIDIFDLTSSKPGFTEVDISVLTDQGGPRQSTLTQSSTGGPGTKENAQVRIFGGEYINTVWDMDTDAVHIKARDWAGQLLDQKRVLTKIGKAIESALRPLAPGRISAAGISGENQKVGDIVTSVANEFGFNPILNLSEDGRNPTIGTLYGSADQAFFPLPQSLWNVLNQLARDTGYVVYTTPNKDLVFGEPGAGLDTIQLSYADSQQQSGYRPSKALKLEHHPRRNSTFRVVVISYDPSRAQATLGRAAYVGGNFAGLYGIQQGVVSGADANKVDAALKKFDASVGQVALYTFHVDGLDQDQANLRAFSIASDIAKREVIVSASIDGLANILPTQKVQLSSQIIPSQFTAPTYYVSSYSHQFTMPNPEAHRHDAGWMTHLTALNIPTEALATEVQG